MSEIQIPTIKVLKEDLSFADTGGATREVAACITVDSSIHPDRQRECLVHEILGIYLGTVLDVDMLSQIAQSINEAIIEWEKV